MAAKTTNLGLTQPSQEDFYNVDDFNQNFQKIDDFVGRKDNPHGVTAEQVGAAPKSLVHDHKTIPTNEELNTSLLNWFNSMGSGEIKNFTIDTRVNGLSIPGGISMVTINKTSILYGVIELVLYNDITPALRVCSIYNGELTDWRELIPINRQNSNLYRMEGNEIVWFNPPMLTGVEYRTSEYFGGKPVYTKLISCGAMPTFEEYSMVGEKSVKHGITNIKQIVSTGGYMKNTTNGDLYSLPHDAAVASAGINVGKTDIHIWTTGDFNACNEVQVWVKYTKN